MTAYKWLPEQPTDEMVDTAMSSLPLSIPEVQVKQIYSLLWKAAPAVEQEPVGYADAESITYLLEGGDSGILIVPEPTDTRDTPLYTHPPKREPLSEDCIKEILNELPYSGYDLYVGFARAIEKAHGIESNNG
jgi:hypothetical protein